MFTPGSIADMRIMRYMRICFRYHWGAGCVRVWCRSSTAYVDDAKKLLGELSADMR